MKVYRVGGSVRDKLLGLETRESDWVVVGATPEQLLQQGYRLVGKDFPVFLHPLTQEEYALARTERKTAPGYHGFAVHAAPDVTLEDDLRRRDLTINAIAEADDGAIVDPFGGRADLDARQLRHISPAFAEDPVRILRVARFAATFAHLGFGVADETLGLMRRMVAAGEADALVAERVWKETERALGAPTPARFFEVLRDCGALATLFPEIDALFGVPQPPQHHPEIDTGVHTMMVLTQAARLSADARVRFAALVHDLGKGTTDPQHWPTHHGHEERGLKSLDTLCERLRVPKDYRELAQHVMQYHGQYHRAGELRPATILKLLKAVDALRRPERFELFMLACEADSRGRPGYEELHYEQPGIMRRALAAANSVATQSLIDQGFSGAKLGRELDKQRVAAIAAAVK